MTQTFPNGIIPPLNLNLHATATAPVPDSTPSTPTSRRRAANWLPMEEQQLAMSWLAISQMPEFSTNQTGDQFYARVAEDFRIKSTIHPRDVAHIKNRFVLVLHAPWLLIFFY